MLKMVNKFVGEKCVIFSSGAADWKPDSYSSSLGIQLVNPSTIILYGSPIESLIHLRGVVCRSRGAAHKSLLTGTMMITG
jgi:hypothetical protein